jgi:hypothetical protein
MNKVAGLTAKGVPTIGRIIGNAHPDSMIHITTATEKELAKGLETPSIFARYGDVAHMTVSEYQTGVVGPAAAGFSSDVKAFVVSYPGEAQFIMHWEKGLAGVTEHASVGPVIPSRYCSTPWHTMKHEEIELRVLQLLQEKSECELTWARPPEVKHIPFMGSRENFFLLVSVVLTLWPDENIRLVKHCLSICRSIIGSGILKQEKGLEVVAYVNEKMNMRRVIRFSVLRTAFSKVAEVEAAEIIAKGSVGITCQFPPER